MPGQVYQSITRLPCWRGFDGDNVTVHEFAHSIMNLGIVPIQPDFLAELTATYDAAVAADLWDGTFAATNIHEYWAEGVQSYFNANLDPPDPVVGQGKCPGKCSAKMSLRYAAMVSDVDGLGTIRCFHPGGPPASR